MAGTADMGPKGTAAAAKVAEAAPTPAAPAREVVEIASNDSGPKRVILPTDRPKRLPFSWPRPRAGASSPARRPWLRSWSPRAAPAEAEAEPSLASKALDTAVAAHETVKGGVVAAKDTVVAGASAVGSGAVAVASAGARTVREAATAVRDTITGDPKIDRLIEKAADENDIPRELAYAVVRVESHYNPRARGSGVYGLSQIKPATARGPRLPGARRSPSRPRDQPSLRHALPEGRLRAGQRRRLPDRHEVQGRPPHHGDVEVGQRLLLQRQAPHGRDPRPQVARHGRRGPDPGGRRRAHRALRPDRPRSRRPARRRPQGGHRSGLGRRDGPAEPAPAQTAPAQAAAALSVPAASAPLPVARPVRVADNSPRPAPSASKAADGSIGLGSMVGGRVVRQQPAPDVGRFGDAFDASAPASAPPAGGLGFN